MLQAGDIFGSYEIIATIDGGGMGVVYKARHRLQGTIVALKVLLPNLALRETMRHRFEQEAYVQKELNHPNIVNVVDLVHAHGTLGLAMDLVEGSTLHELITDERAGPWSNDESMTLMAPILEAMAYAHQRGVVHRDLKPANVLLDRTKETSPGVPRITDFGLAKIVADEGGMTRTGTRMGTVPYSAPEQYLGKEAKAPCVDVYALGMMLWRFWMGRLPIDPDDQAAVFELYTGRGTEDVLAPLRETVPEPMAAVVLSCLSIEPSERPPDAGALLAALKEVRRAVAQEEARPKPVPFSRGSLADTSAAPLSGQPAPVSDGSRTSHVRTSSVLLFVIVAAVLTWGLFAWLNSNAPPLIEGMVGMVVTDETAEDSDEDVQQQAEETEAREAEEKAATDKAAKKKKADKAKADKARADKAKAAKKKAEKVKAAKKKKAAKAKAAKKKKADKAKEDKAAVEKAATEKAAADKKVADDKKFKIQVLIEKGKLAFGRRDVYRAHKSFAKARHLDPANPEAIKWYNKTVNHPQRKCGDGICGKSNHGKWETWVMCPSDCPFDSVGGCEWPRKWVNGWCVRPIPLPP